MSEEIHEQDKEILGDDNTEDLERVTVSFHPLRGIGIDITDASGQTAGATMGVEEASVFVLHITSLINMLYQQQYMRAMQENALISQLLAEEASQLTDKLWTPPEK